MSKDKRMSEADLLAAVRNAARQEQFLEVVSPEEAQKRFTAHLDLSAFPAESVALDSALGRALAHDIAAPLDVPPFDRSGVDGFALRAEDIVKANEAAPLKLRLNAEVIACGHAPKIEVLPGTASTIATGGMLPRGADA
ncbi:MAG TPA: molybdopterin biosynthesis protein, partial [Pseudorhodoplanes sp.]|nr:molybdopterin biosynthesis protein [Pseudorhodoplanes sp.]